MIIPILLYYLGDTWAVAGLCGKCLEIHGNRRMLFGCVMIGLKIVTHIIGKSVPSYCIIPSLCMHLFLIGLIMIFSGAEKEKKLFTAAMIIAGRRLLWNFCDSFSAAIVIIILHLVKKEERPVIGINTVYAFGIEVVVYTAGILLICFLAEYGMFLFEDKSRKWFLIASVPLLLLTVIVDLSNWGAEHGILLRSGGDWNLYYDQLFSYTGNCILAVLCMFSAGAYVFGMDRIDIERKKEERYLARIESYKMLEEHYQQTRKFRHDHKNHMIALSGLIENKEYEKAGNYLKQMMRTVNLGVGEEFTGNSAVDALFYQKRKKAEDKNILWECDVSLPQEYPINEYDLCVVFGNVLDNAIEACEQCHEIERFIKIHALVVKKCLLLEVENSIENADMAMNGFSRKENPEEHGIGLSNVKDVISIYNGTMNVKIEGYTYVISILFPMQQ